MRQNFFLILALATMIPAFTFTQCKNVPKRELMMMDTLDTIIIRTKEYLSYDLITINNRKQRISEDQSLVRRFYRDTIDNELGQTMVKYKGIYKIYNKFIDNYQDVYNEMVASQKQSHALRNSVTDNKLDKEEFKEFYAKEKQIALDNLLIAKDISIHIPEVEPDFQRISRYVEELLLHTSEKLIRNSGDSTLRKILDTRN